MPKISEYDNGDPPQSSDQFVIARSGANKKLLWSNLTDALQAFFVALTGNQTVAGVKTFSSFPVTPSSAPTTDYQVANKKYVDDTANFAVFAVGGRLTLTSGTPITTSDVTAATSIYWTPYKGDQLPYYDGSSWSMVTQAELTLTLNNPNHAANTLYDIFYFDDSGTKRIGTGPAWSSSAAGSSSRGSGAGTTELELLNGIYVNKVSMTVRNGANTYTVDANEGTFLGTFMTTASAGQTEDSQTFCGLANFYNAVYRELKKNQWVPHSYGTAAWRYMNNDSTQVIKFISCFDVSVNISYHARDIYGGHLSGAGLNSSSGNLLNTFAYYSTGAYLYAGGLSITNINEGYNFVAMCEYGAGGAASVSRTEINAGIMK